jgi:hypothetical protein
MRKLVLAAVVVAVAACAPKADNTAGGATMDSAAMMDSANQMMDSASHMMDSAATMKDSAMARDTSSM